MRAPTKRVQVSMEYIHRAQSKDIGTSVRPGYVLHCEATWSLWVRLLVSTASGLVGKVDTPRESPAIWVAVTWRLMGLGSYLYPGL